MMDLNAMPEGYEECGIWMLEQENRIGSCRCAIKGFEDQKVWIDKAIDFEEQQINHIQTRLDKYRLKIEKQIEEEARTDA